MHDTIQIFGARLSELAELWRKIVARKLQPANARTVSNASMALFGELSDDIRRAAEISAERALSPQGLLEACRYGFTQTFLKPRS